MNTFIFGFFTCTLILIVIGYIVGLVEEKRIRIVHMSFENFLIYYFNSDSKEYFHFSICGDNPVEQIPYFDKKTVFILNPEDRDAYQLWVINRGYDDWIK